ncbi:four helix bundle protein [Candidatus Falkowbacteria bacterium]|nr:MAG: four helix bundle protein [Candidatus Falkowbacteria bacterium]
MNKEELKARTKKFALRVINLTNALPNTKAGNVISSQLLRSGTSVGANYRAVCLSKSKADFISKLGIVVEEADESAFWMELIIESKLIPEFLINNLLNETYEIVAIMVSSRKSAMKNK